MPRTYNNGGCTVVIEDDGAILVKPGDSLSKYSMAIHGNYSKFNEYSRKQGEAHRPIANVNKIFHGETLYHEPTRRLRTSPVGGGEQELDRATIERIFQREFGGTSVWDSGSTYVNLTRMGLSANALGPMLGGAAFGVAGGMFGMLSSIYMSYKALSYVGNFGNRAAGTRGFNYGMVAWAYDDGVLPFPKGWDTTLRAGSHGQHVQVYRNNWASGFSAGQAACEKEFRAQKIEKYDLQNLLIALSGPNQALGPQCLAARLLLDFASREMNGRYNYSQEVRYYLMNPYSWYPHDDSPILGNSRRPPYPEKLNALYPRWP